MTSPHIIRRQYLEVEVIGTESDGFALHRRLPDLCRDWLNPALESVLERTVPANERWLIDRLEIDAGSFRLDELERDLAEAVTEALERYFRERAGAGSASRTQAVASSTPITRRLEAQSLQEAFVYFLETGVLPWWFQLPAGKGLEECIREAWRAEAQPDGRPEQFARALGLVIGAAAVRQRLVWQFSAGFLGALLASLSETAANSVLQILERLDKQDIESRTVGSFGEGVWESAFVLTLAGKPVTSEILLAESLLARSQGSTSRGSGAEHQDALLAERITQLWPGVKSAVGIKEADSRLEKRALDESDAVDGRGTSLREPPGRSRERHRPASRVNLEEGVYVGCAGVVLLHPFLPRLFEALGIVKDDRMLKPERALSMLHFLATGQRVAPEYDLILPKLLCNLPLEAPVQSRIELTAAEEEEAVALLGAVIRYWDALGETSVDGLRGSFLVRPGKLSQRSGDAVLQVEARSYDMLLDRLPWSIGVIQLPWMQRVLWVEWRF